MSWVFDAFAASPRAGVGGDFDVAAEHTDAAVVGDKMAREYPRTITKTHRALLTPELLR